MIGQMTGLEIEKESKLFRAEKFNHGFNSDSYLAGKFSLIWKQ